MEDPIHAYAVELAAARSAGGHVHSAEIAASEHEAAGVVEKLTGPLLFKAIGVASAIIDAFVYRREGLEARRRGDFAVSVGKFAISGGSAVMAVGWAFGFAGQALRIGALAVASTTLLVIGAVIALIGFIIVSYFSKSAWQTFASHCCFGNEGADGLTPPKSGHETWSGGDFLEWEFTKEGLDRQIEVFMALLCSFKVAGSLDDYQKITVTFGAIPPKAKLHLAFSITYATDETKHPEYTVDLQNPDDAVPGGDATKPVMANPGSRNGQLTSVVLTAERFSGAPVKSATCELVIRYAPHSSGSHVANGIVPIGGGLKYKMVTNGHINGDTLDSTDVERKEPTISLPTRPRTGLGI